jgi:Xaa-Pro aminopeptidase
LSRVRGEAGHCRVLPYSFFERKWVRRKKGEPASFLAVLEQVLRDHRIRKVTVPESFPLGLARGLRKSGFKVRVREGAVFPERAVKSAEEVKKISAALVMAEVGMAEGIQSLKRSKVGKGKRLFLHQAPLTSERLRAIIDTAVLQAGGAPNRTIVAGGRQSVEPHERGHGPLVADQPIVIDVFPRSQKTGYYGDLTRTVVKGRASAAVRAMYMAVLEAQTAALQRLRHGVAAREIHEGASEFFRSRGFATRHRADACVGFVHALGHGLGLDIHEAPRIAANSTDVLRSGNVVTLEPGLYYPETGGIRVEDVACVGAGKARNLTKFEKELEI